ncbi:MAG: hypothetical protein Q8930_12450 [Bacillota bacterium]|nr:hypothetical protein [Bacillota bacterium]
MPVLSHSDIESFLLHVKEQVESERILYGAQILSAVEKIAEEKEIDPVEIQDYIFAEQWLLLNVPMLQDDRPSMKRHHEAVLQDKYEYYNRTGNFEGLYTWIASVLRNIGFTDYQADTFIAAAKKIGEKLHKRNGK